MMAYRASVHASIGVTPYKMVFGREITLPLQVVIGRPGHVEEEQAVDDYVHKLQNSISESHRVARKH